MSTLPLISRLESVLFVASRPVSVQKLSRLLKVDAGNIGACLLDLSQRYASLESGLMLVHSGDEWQLVTRPDNKADCEQFVKAEFTGELTRPQLETLTVISYCGPITKPELEQLRGVNCGLIIRNLLMRGLISEIEERGSLLLHYQASIEYLRFLGLSSVQDLPQYAELHAHEYVTRSLASDEAVSSTA